MPLSELGKHPHHLAVYLMGCGLLLLLGSLVLLAVGHSSAAAFSGFQSITNAVIAHHVKPQPDK